MLSVVCDSWQHFRIVGTVQYHSSWPFSQHEMRSHRATETCLGRSNCYQGSSSRHYRSEGFIKVKVHTLDIAPLCSESSPQKRSGMARVLKGFHSFTCTPTRSFAIGMSHTCLCLPSYNWYSFTDPGGMEG